MAQGTRKIQETRTKKEFKKKAKKSRLKIKRLKVQDMVFNFEPSLYFSLGPLLKA